METFKEKFPTITFRVDKHVKKKIKERADRRKIKLSEFVKQLVINSLVKEGVLEIKYEFKDEEDHSRESKPI